MTLNGILLIGFCTSLSVFIAGVMLNKLDKPWMNKDIVMAVTIAFFGTLGGLFIAMRWPFVYHPCILIMVTSLLALSRKVKSVESWYSRDFKTW